MAEELLARNCAGPSSHKAKHQQCGFRHSAPALARRRFIHAIDHQRKHIGEQEPADNGMGGKHASDRGNDEEQVTEAIEIHRRGHGRYYGKLCGIIPGRAVRAKRMS